MTKRLKVGDVCITQNADKFPLLNDGTTVVIVSIDRAQRDHRRRAVPYRIKRIDGQSFPASCNQRTGAPSFDKCTTVWARRDQLRKPDLDQPGWSDWEAIEQLKIQRMIERGPAWATERGEKV